MTTKEIVGPLSTVRFRGGATVVADVPRDTCDRDRWSNCTEHHVACDCREAEMAEQISELRAELKAAQDTARRILFGHATYAYERGVEPGSTREIGCQCTGCQIAREARLIASYEGGPSARDQVDGVYEDWVEPIGGVRWLVCTERTRRDHRGVCTWAKTRDGRERGPFHEHLIGPDGVPHRDYSDMEPPF